MKELHIPDVRYHLLDDSTGRFLAEDRHGDDGLFLVGFGDAFMLSFDDLPENIRRTAAEWGRPCTVIVSVDGDLVSPANST